MYKRIGNTYIYIYICVSVRKILQQFKNRGPDNNPATSQLGRISVFSRRLNSNQLQTRYVIWALPAMYP
jgi:hypothetical protein